MKKLLFIFASTAFLGACFSHVTEDVVGYNEDGKTIVKVCKTKGTPSNYAAFGTTCKIEKRDYGRVSNKTETLNIISESSR